MSAEGNQYFLTSPSVPLLEEREGRLFPERNMYYIIFGNTIFINS